VIPIRSCCTGRPKWLRYELRRLILSKLVWALESNSELQRRDIHQLLAEAIDLDDLRVPPGNRLESLKGEWQGFHSIRINDTDLCDYFTVRTFAGCSALGSL
jgi:plasmid maintenance system killer protein